MNRIRITCLVTALTIGGLTHPVAAVEELAAPLNAVADDVSGIEVSVDEGVGDEAIPVSPYDVVPYELDPAVELHSVRAAPRAVTAYSPAFAPAPQWSPPHIHAAAAACCVAPKVRYWNHPLLASDICPCDCDQTIETHLLVPCQCCPVMVQVCVPVCCVGAPRCEAGWDLLGRKTYDYCWPCGYRVKIVDRHTGTLMVHTFNR